MNKKLSIIIVDDLQFSRIVVKTALKKAGYHGVRLADSARKALKLLDTKPADVVLADWMMPDMDGLELTKQIRQRDEEKGIYTSVILFTANEGVEYLVEAFDVGVDDFLSKPPNPKELAARVNAAARISIMQNDLLETTRQTAETIKRLEESSLTDTVTDAGNLKLLIKELRAHLLDASSRNGGVCLIMIELDQLAAFESENESAIVNELLNGIHRRLRRTVRPMDLIARLDNNIFSIIMHHRNVGDFKESAIERIEEGIQNRPYKTTAGEIELTPTMGIHYYNSDNQVLSAEKMISEALKKLELAKSSDKKIAY